MEWISVKEQLPPVDETGMRKHSYLLAYHSIFGTGVGWFYILDEWLAEQLSEEYGDKYLCSCQFIKNYLDGNYCIDEEREIDIFEHSPHFFNLGTVTHWMPLPEKPNGMD
jgi:hypothetical protein